MDIIGNGFRFRILLTPRYKSRSIWIEFVNFRERAMSGFLVRRFGWQFVIYALLICRSEFAVAQKKVGAASFAVDLVTLDSGKRLRGAFAGVDADGVVSMAVQREWLKKTRPEMYDKVTRNEAVEAKDALTDLRTRVRQWLNEKPESNALVTFLEIELERIEDRLSQLNDARGNAVTSQFVMLKFSRQEAKYSFAQPPENRRLAMLAWRERFEDVEVRKAADIEEQLRDQGIDPTAEMPDLAGRLPVTRQDGTEWAARRAIIEFELSGKLEFQGIGNALVRTDAGAAKVGLEQLLPKLLPLLLQDQPGGQLAGQLQAVAAASIPDFRGAIREAERAKVKGFRATTVALNLQQKQANVETWFMAKLPNGTWELIWSHKAMGDPSKPRPDIQQQIENDPQIAEALKLAKSFGLGVGGQLQTAMNFGAATMEAQKAADQEFFRFLDKYMKHVDGPGLSWSADKTAKK